MNRTKKLESYDFIQRCNYCAYEHSKSVMTLLRFNMQESVVTEREDFSILNNNTDTLHQPIERILS